MNGGIRASLERLDLPRDALLLSAFLHGSAVQHNGQVYTATDACTEGIAWFELWGRDIGLSCFGGAN